MGFLAGETVTAGRLNLIQPATYDATGSTNLALATTEADVAGAAITLTSLTANATYIAQAVFQFDITTATMAFASGVCQLDGSSLSGNARWAAANNTDFATGAQMWRGPVGTAGSHTFKLRGSMSSGTGIQILGAFTKLIVTIYEAY
jgi:hypothetical protein